MILQRFPGRLDFSMIIKKYPNPDEPEPKRSHAKPQRKKTKNNMLNFSLRLGALA